MKNDTTFHGSSVAMFANLVHLTHLFLACDEHYNSSSSSRNKVLAFSSETQPKTEVFIISFKTPACTECYNDTIV